MFGRHRRKPAVEARCAPRKQYSTFAAALADSGEGYGDRELARVVLAKTLSARAAGSWPDLSWYQGAGLFFVLPYAALKCASRPLRILDFGGAFGLHGMIAMDRFPGIPMQWAIVESPSFAAMAAAVESDVLRVFHSIEGAMEWLGGVDLMHSSGALQYLPDPDGALAELVALNAPLMLWQRMMLATGCRTTVVTTMRLSDNGAGPLPPGQQDRNIRFPEVFLTEAELFAVHQGYKPTVHIPGTDLIAEGLARFGDVILLEKNDGA